MVSQKRDLTYKKQHICSYYIFVCCIFNTLLASDILTMNPQALSVLRDDYKLSTWLYLGAFLQAMLLIIYPSRVVAIPALLMIAYRVAKNLILRCGIVRDPSLDKVRQGKTSAQVINRDGTIPERPSDKDIVVFILGARANE